jgi:hypothetical protein
MSPFSSFVVQLVWALVLSHHLSISAFKGLVVVCLQVTLGARKSDLETAGVAFGYNIQ